MKINLIRFFCIIILAEVQEGFDDEGKKQIDLCQFLRTKSLQTHLLVNWALYKGNTLSTDCAFGSQFFTALLT